MDRSSCPDLGFAERLGGFLYMILYLLWHPASSSMGMKKKKPHEIWFTYQLSVKIEDNFTENLRCWCRYFMLSTVTQDNGFAEFQELHSPKLLFLLLCCSFFRFQLSSTPADSSFFRKRILVLDKQYFVLLCCSRQKQCGLVCMNSKVFPRKNRQA